MKVRLCLSGRLRKGPEQSLFNDYLSRARKTGKLINLSTISVAEYDSGRWKKFLTEIGLSKEFSKAYKVLLDERGKNFSSRSFADTLRSRRDGGTFELVFFIGGADGMPAGLNFNFDEIVSFGKMVWPHSLARVMLMEQIYRATTILAGLPYHKE